MTPAKFPPSPFFQGTRGNLAGVNQAADPPQIPLPKGEFLMFGRFLEIFIPDRAPSSSFG